MIDLAFVITMRHPDNADNYQVCESLLQATLASVCRQTHPSFAVVVVANRHPSFPLPPQVQFVKVGFPAPSQILAKDMDRYLFRMDKGSKIAVAMLACPACHYMTVDADDFVSRDVAAFVAEHPGGWFVERGYRYSTPRRLVQPQEGFNDVCGTSLLYPADVIKIPRGVVGIDASQDEVIAAFGEDVVTGLLGSHRFMRVHCAELGRPLAPLPFPAAVYNVGTGDNRSGDLPMGFGVPVSTRLAEEFGLPRSRRAYLWVLVQSLPIAVMRIRRELSRASGRLRQILTTSP